ncbi:ABC transporter ATP-binding protein [Gordonia hydrophobica]|uniref:ABC transporter ATP-binding protein n=1 Tax=Gordonia hydrophobica TaxID=40516 RepID=UPI000A7BC80D|nr:ABC transporter ATP-binding protein [Gordonia hydrophobica]
MSKGLGPRLVAEDIAIGYSGGRLVSDGLDLVIDDGSFTVIVGPNACGKSTLLRALTRLLPPVRGRVLLDGKAIADHPAKAVAREIGLLPQSSIAPDGITVRDLVARGRFPHQGLLRQWSPHDQQVTDAAMERTRVDDLADRFVDELSGGQRQRVWLAMALAQETSIVLLDEPTTYLDIAHQVEVLELCRVLNEEEGKTIVAVLHDLNQACRYAHTLIAMKDGHVIGSGAPHDVLTEELVREVFGVDALVTADPVTGTPLMLPRVGPRSPRPATTGDAAVVITK